MATMLEELLKEMRSLNANISDLKKQVTALDQRFTDADLQSRLSNIQHDEDIESLKKKSELSLSTFSPLERMLTGL